MTGSTKSAKSEGFRTYRKKGGLEVTAVRLALEFEGFEYRKWGSVQRAKKGDWLLDNRGDIYTVDAETFEATYAEASPGRFVKQATVWAKEAKEAGAIPTKEGTTEYEAGDFLVFNDADLDDGYAVARDEFLAMYDRAE